MKTLVRHKIAGLCLTIPIFFVFFVTSVQALAITDDCSSFYVKFEGVLQNEDDVFLVIFTNGTKLPQKRLSMTFSMDYIKDNEYNVRLVVETESFVAEQIITSAKISDGQLTVNSTKSLFMFNQNLLNEGKVTVFTELMAGKIVGNVSRIGKASTAIDDKRVEARMVLANYEINSKKELFLALGFDSNTGLLVYAGGAFSDILLEEMAIKYIYGGLFNLQSYSDSLDFVLHESPLFVFNPWFLLIVLPLVFIFLVTIIYFIKKKNRKNK